MATAMDGPDVLNLCRQHLKKVEPAQGNQHYSCLLLDHNEIPRLENVETFSSLNKLSASHNQLLRMYGVARLYSLRVLNLSHNNIVSIEGLKDLKYLAVLNLAGNNIKTIEHLASNSLLEVLDLSDNAISVIPDLSHMKNLKKLHLHSNRIKSLQFCDKFLAPSLHSLTLAENGLADLNEVSRIAHLTLLESFSVANCPCGLVNNCDYRPFVLNWIPSLKILDDVLVNPREGLAAEWLYSQGKGRQFKVGQHDELVAYLTSVRPADSTGGLVNGSEDDHKLDRILSLARLQQQQQLGEPVVPVQPSPTPQRRVPPATAAVKKTTPSMTRKQATPPRGAVAEAPPLWKATRPAPSLHHLQQRLPEVDLLSMEPMPALMCQSLDSAAALERSASQVAVGSTSRMVLPRPVSGQEEVKRSVDDSFQPVSGLRRTVSAASERRPLFQRNVNSKPKVNSKLPVSKSSAPPPAVSGQRTGDRTSGDRSMSEVQAAVTIQKVWRGYQTRHLDPQIREVKTRLRLNRTEDHVADLMTRGQGVEQLRRTCDSLQKEVRQLQLSMRQVLDWIVVAQQQQLPVPRPRTLQLTSKSTPDLGGGQVHQNSSMGPGPVEPVEQFAQGMAHRLIQSISKDNET